MVPCRSLWGFMGPYKSLCILKNCNGSLCFFLSPYWSLRVFMCSCGSFWSFCVLMGSYGPIRGIWILMAPYALYLIGPYPS